MICRGFCVEAGLQWWSGVLRMMFHITRLRYWGGGFGCCCCLFLSSPPPNSFRKKPFFFGGVGWVVSGALPSGGVFWAVGVAGGVAGGPGCALGCGVEWEPPRPKSFWMRVWGLSVIWLQLFGGAVPSRKAAEKELPGQEASARRLVVLSMRTVVTPSGAEKGLTSEYCGSLMARFMNSAQMGAAARAPASLTSV